MESALLGALLLSIVFSINEVAMLGYTIHMLEVRRDILRKPSILLFLLCLNASNIMGGISSFFLLAGSQVVSAAFSEYTAMLRDSMILLVIQRLIYMLERGNVCKQIVRKLLITCNVLNNVAFGIMLVVHLSTWPNLSEVIVSYLTIGEIIIIVLYVIVATTYWIVFRKMLRAAFKVALSLVLLAHCFRVANNLYIGNKQIQGLNIVLTITILVNVIFFMALLFFLNIIIQDPAEKQSILRKKAISLLTSTTSKPFLIVT